MRASLHAGRPALSIELDCVIFSKNRPMQLDACLRSILRHAPYEGSITVVYRATSDAFHRGYAQLDLAPRVRLVPQGDDFEAAVRDVLARAGERIVFHTDDDLFFRSPRRAPDVPNGCASFSLRLGENTRYCYPFARDQELPRRESDADFMVWNWADADGDFAYPMSLDGHIFDTARFRAVLAGARFGDPNELERELHLRRHRAPRVMASYRHSCVVAVPVNIVTDSIVNRSGVDAALTSEALNDRFLRGERIDLDALDDADVRAAHAEITLAFSTPDAAPEA